MDELDAYRRAFNICRDALKVIATYGNRGLEEYLMDNGYTRDMLDVWRNSKPHMEYLRLMDYEVAEGALGRALDVLKKFESGDQS